MVVRLGCGTDVSQWFQLFGVLNERTGPSPVPRNILLHTISGVLRPEVHHVPPSTTPRLQGPYAPEGSERSAKSSLEAQGKGNSCTQLSRTDRCSKLVPPFR